MPLLRFDLIEGRSDAELKALLDALAFRRRAARDTVQLCISRSNCRPFHACGPVVEAVRARLAAIRVAKAAGLVQSSATAARGTGTRA